MTPLKRLSRSGLGGFNLGGKKVRRLLTLRAEHLRADVVLERVAVQLHELREVELRLLHRLHLADKAILDRVDTASCLLDLLAKRLRNQLLQDFTHLVGPGVAGLANLLLPALRE